MSSSLALFEEPHHQALELLSARALASGDIATAFRLSDRRCRIAPLAEPHCYLLRGDALFRMGEKQAALEDIARAIDIAPNDIAANRRMLMWSDGPPQHEAALSLIANSRDMKTLRQAMAALRHQGKMAFASATTASDAVHGWAAWHRNGAVRVAITDESSTVTWTLQPDRSHPLADDAVLATNFALPIPPSDRAQLITISFKRETLVSIWTSEKFIRKASVRAFGDFRTSVRLRPQHQKAASESPATVIVPVYADFEATKACIDSLLTQSPDSPPWRVIVVNDATPDARIGDYLACIAKDRHVRILTNERNRGFVWSINRAMAEVAHGDIVLLNADTIVPAGFVDRLAAAAQASPDIGTVTPISNNGEFTSFPVPNVQNPMLPVEEIAAVDRIAADVNAWRVVDIPNGIGFCLYITRNCLNAVGFLSTDYHRGYLEDVDFCLRARELGFRNVCAPSVYVGHAGSRSFGKAKRTLVVRNLAIAECRFPKYRTECAAFVALDPLRASRQAIERAAPPRNRHPRLVVTGQGSLASVAKERARSISAEGQVALILEVRSRPGSAAVSILNPSGSAPQSLTFDLAGAGEAEALLIYLRAVAPSRIEITDPANIPVGLFESLTELGVPYDILVADAGLLGNDSARYFGKSDELCPQTISARRRIENGCTPDSEAAHPVKYLRDLAAKADRLLAPCPQAEAFIAQYVAPCSASRPEVVGLGRPADHPLRNYSGPRNGSRNRLGIIPVRLSVPEQQLMRDIAIGFKRCFPTCSIVVIGSTLNDLALMRIGNTFVTGSFDISEIDHLCRTYALGSLFLCITHPLFGHPLQSSAQATGLPLAYFDWSNGLCVPSSNHLLLNPLAPTEEVIGALARWIRAS
jgi:O-antigen biosynthesis protein